MSTSIKELTPFGVLFKRPAIALGFCLIIATILVKPIYNIVPVLAGIILYFILYQNRRSIYRLGMGRFDFLAFLFYFPFVLSAFISWAYSPADDIAVKNQIVNIKIWDFIVNHDYNSAVINWFSSFLDKIIHWKMVLFSPAFAAILYLIFVEFDRKSVKDTDLQSLGLTDGDLYGEGIITQVMGILAFIIACSLYGVQFGLWAFIFIAAMALLPAFWFLIVSIVASIVILVLNFAAFDYTIFLSVPNRFINVAGDKGLWAAIKEFYYLGRINNIGQWYILVPYFLMSGLVAWTHLRNSNKVYERRQEKVKAEEITNTPDAFDFGYDMLTRKTVRLTHKELNTHMYINGSSGSGKTVAMLNFVVEAAQKKLPLVYIDGKGSNDLAEAMSKIAEQYGRVFRIFTLSPKDMPNVSAYDFLGAGTFTEKKNRIMQLFIQAEAAGAAYYQDSLETFINNVFMIIHSRKLRIDLFRFLELITKINDLIGLAEQDIILDDGSRINLKSYFEEIRDMKPDQSPQKRIVTKLNPFIYSSYGQLFNVVDKANVINLKESILNGEIVLFLFNSSAFSLDTERIAKMVISDLNATFSEFGRDGKRIKTICCYDEFKSYQTDAISKTISLHRSNGMHAVIGTQSLSLIDKDIANGILSNCQTHLVMACSDDDAERFSEEFGKADKIEYTTRVKADVQQVSDVITKSIKDYQVDKQDIKNVIIGSGRGYLHRKAIGAKPIKIQVTQKIKI